MFVLCRVFLLTTNLRKVMIWYSAAKLYCGNIAKSKCVRIYNKIRREIELLDFLNFTHLSGLKLIIVGTKIFQFCKWLCSIIILVHCCFWKGRCRRYAKNYTFNQCFFTEILWSHFVLLYLIVIFLAFCEICNNIILNFGGIQRTDI